jgi:hypothetical protein
MKSNRLRAVEDNTRQLEEKDRQIGEQNMKNTELTADLNNLKQEHIRKVEVLKKNIENLSNKNKAMAKTHQGNHLGTTLPCQRC